MRSEFGDNEKNLAVALKYANLFKSYKCYLKFCYNFDQKVALS